MKAIVLPPVDPPERYADSLKPRIAAADAALPRVALSYATTTLDGFDKDAQVVSCSTTLTAKLDGYSAQPLRWAYTVQPAAEGGQVVVKSDDGAARQAVLLVLGRYVDDKLGFH